MGRPQKIMAGIAVRDRLDAFMLLCMIGILLCEWIGLPVSSWAALGGIFGVALALTMFGVRLRSFHQRSR